jgi:hypothetical protein
MTVTEIVRDIEARIATNRAQFDLLQSLRDRYSAGDEPAPTPAPAQAGSAEAAVVPRACREPAAEQQEPKRRVMAPRGIALAFRKWIAAQPAEFEILAARQALGGTQSAVSCAALKLLRGGQLERVRNGWYRRTAKFEAPAETVADRYARASGELRARLNPGLNTETRTCNAA